MELHAENRERLMDFIIDAALGDDDNNYPDDATACGIILLRGGEQTTRHSSDHEPLFRQESYFHW